jgi:cysteine desulfurase/selenocysteine lyase
LIEPTAPPLARSSFSIQPGLVYLNHAAAGILPALTRDALIGAIEDHARRGVLGTWPMERDVPLARRTVAAFIGAKSGDDIAFLRATGDGANVIARGLDWQPGDEIVLPGDEFGSNAYPWLALREYGVSLRFIDAPSERMTPEVLAAALTPRTRLVAVSWVSFVDGYRHDLAALSAIAHERGALFCVDAIQALGAFPIDVDALGIDALYAGGAKWLMALQGVSFLYVRPELRERLRVRWHGWKAVSDIWDFLNYDQPLAPDSSRYEGGTQNFLGVLSLDRSIGVLQAAGIDAISRHVISLTDRLGAGLERAGARIASVRGATTSSGIVTFDLPGRDPIELGKLLQQRGFVTTYRKNGIRVSPHGHTSHDEIDAFLAALAQ